jgi:hypothetical protein
MSEPFFKIPADAKHAVFTRCRNERHGWSQLPHSTHNRILRTGQCSSESEMRCYSVASSKVVRAIAPFLAVVMIVPQDAKSDELDSLRSAIEASRRSKMCPPGGEYSILEFSSYCKQWCDIGWTCRGTKQTDPCENGDREGCHRFSEGSSQCLQDMNEKNKVIIDYNEIVRQCHRGEAQGRSPSSTPKQPQGRALGAELQQAKQKAEEARAKAREAEAKAAQKRAAVEAEKNKMKEEAKALPSWCEGLISSCQQRAASLSNASSGTQSQCNAYCQTLMIENCNGSSSTVQGAAQACNSGAQRDQRQAMEEDKRRRETERRREEEANRIPSGWVKCPCPADDMYLIAQGRAKLINGVLYHPRDVGPCGGG